METVSGLDEKEMKASRESLGVAAEMVHEQTLRVGMAATDSATSEVDAEEGEEPSGPFVHPVTGEVGGPKYVKYARVLIPCGVRVV